MANSARKRELLFALLVLTIAAALFYAGMAYERQKNYAGHVSTVDYVLSISDLGKINTVLHTYDVKHENDQNAAAIFRPKYTAVYENPNVKQHIIRLHSKNITPLLNGECDEGKKQLITERMFDIRSAYPDSLHASLIYDQAEQYIKEGCK